MNDTKVTKVALARDRVCSALREKPSWRLVDALIEAVKAEGAAEQRERPCDFCGVSPLHRQPHMHSAIGKSFSETSNELQETAHREASAAIKHAIEVGRCNEERVHNAIDALASFIESQDIHGSCKEGE